MPRLPNEAWHEPPQAAGQRPGLPGIRAVLLAFLTLLAAFPLHAAPKGVVLLISDGTSLELLTAARIYKGGVTSRLNLEALPQTAFVSTYSFDGMVTDSGAGATAMARGFKTVNRAVGAAPPGQPTLPSIVDLAKKAGWATGVISDDSVTGATPCSFVMAHGHREEEYVIANLEVQNLGKNCDFLLGGGQRFFQGPAPEERDRIQSPAYLDTVARLPKSNIQVFATWEKWQAAPPRDLSRPILGIFAPTRFEFIADGERKPHLEDLVSEGLRLLQNSGKPWLLVAEAGLADKACHQNLAKCALEEILVLDRTVALIREKIGTDVLFLITTDHNTGGITLNPGQPVGAKGEAILRASSITKMPILTFATGPGGVLDTKVTAPNPETDWTRPDAVSPALSRTGSAYHSGGNVWLLGQGPGSEKVHGFLDNTDIFKIIAAAIAEK